jgi:hypothetical protein
MAFVPFEKSSKDKKEPKGMKEGSRKEEAFDAAQKKKSGKPGVVPGFKCGGKIKPTRG